MQATKLASYERRRIDNSDEEDQRAPKPIWDGGPLSEMDPDWQLELFKDKIQELKVYNEVFNFEEMRVERLYLKVIEEWVGSLTIDWGNRPQMVWVDHEYMRKHHTPFRLNTLAWEYKSSERYHKLKDRAIERVWDVLKEVGTTIGYQQSPGRFNRRFLDKFDELVVWERELVGVEVYMVKGAEKEDNDGDDQPITSMIGRRARSIAWQEWPLHARVAFDQGTRNGELRRREAQRLYERNEQWNRLHAYNFEREINHQFDDAQMQHVHDEWHAGNRHSSRQHDSPGRSYCPRQATPVGLQCHAAYDQRAPAPPRPVSAICHSCVRRVMTQPVIVPAPGHQGPPHVPTNRAASPSVIPHMPKRRPNHQPIVPISSPLFSAQYFFPKKLAA
ncbi:hypothetical protein E3N88_13535 [Mikania micrantha]|uniref:Uncharacterized protein n=1 Tax=Mikania micrantha TaxID=192012 RepID=A0A5N6PBI7_9ASTR|nr:hypothetical protein E3N88_13535 [Mikania micrantha]